MGSFAHRLHLIEAAIPYEDVDISWGSTRHQWVMDVWEHRDDICQLAELACKLLDALTKTAASMMWPERDGLTHLRDSLRRVSHKLRGGTDDNFDSMLCEIEHQVEVPLSPGCREGAGPDSLAVGEEGPKLSEGDACVAFDAHRACWCDAQIIAHKVNDESHYLPGREMFEVHYNGWKKRWDEWMPRD